ncbi:hypothetical protein K0M31_008884 [Melipona bicolor]|uniref:Tektin n=1 Tax=Melipona bicolor TaxID=60889 RepID=A0AA40KJZ7_9HYME|nr:hypothetical protein K0M31_008884 [Melipona bicolor]
MYIITDAEEKVQSGQHNTSRRLGERINDVSFWRNELISKLKRLLQEIERLQDCSVLNKAIKDIESSLHIAEECLYHRETRKELDLKNKESALEIDRMCHQLNNYSHSLKYYTGTQKYDTCFMEQDTWIQAVNQIVKESQTERKLWDAWNNTNNALARRSSELLEAKNELQQYLQMIQQEIFDVEKNLKLIYKAITDKNYILKVAYARLETRIYRPDIELCHDYVHTRFVLMHLLL